MRYRWSDMPLMMTTPLGRWQLFEGIQNGLWPVYRLAATTYRSLTSGLTSQYAIIGSMGKTTAFRAARTVLGLDPDRAWYRNFKTPVALQLLRVPPWQKFGVTEVGIDGPGQMARFADMVRPRAVIVTAIGSEHQRSLRSLETARFEKSWMVRKLRREGLLIINGDDPHVSWMRTRTDARVISCGFGDSCDIRARNYRIDWPRGSSFEIEAFGAVHSFRSRLIGRHMAYPVLSALALAEYSGVDLSLAFTRLASLRPAAGRLETIPLAGGAFLIRDDFKSSLETIHSALDVLETIPARSRGLVLGDISEPPGPQGPLYREIGRRVAGIADWVVFFGNKRNVYAAGACAAGMPKAAIERIGHDLAGVARRALERLQPGDVVLVKGRSTQRMDRISLALQGVPVKCDIRFCDARAFRCETCPMLSTGWGDKSVVI